MFKLYVLTFYLTNNYGLKDEGNLILGGFIAKFFIVGMSIFGATLKSCHLSSTLSVHYHASVQTAHLIVIYVVDYAASRRQNGTLTSCTASVFEHVSN